MTLAKYLKTTLRKVRSVNMGTMTGGARTIVGKEDERDREERTAGEDHAREKMYFSVPFEELYGFHVATPPILFQRNLFASGSQQTSW